MADQSVPGQVVIGLMTTGIGVAIGWSWRRAVDALRLRRAREIWRPFLTGDTLVILAAFEEEFRDFDPSGAVGLGDAMAFAQLRSFFITLGVPDLPSVFANRDVGEKLRRNLILLGGPHGNSITAEAMSKLQLTLKFSDANGDPVIYDSVTAGQYKPAQATSLSGTDLGLIMRAPNPFSPEHQMLLIAGSYGFGTWGGARFLVEDSRKRWRAAAIRHAHFECVVEVNVTHRTPQSSRVLVYRELFAA
jgi:hypothetical protein